MNHLTKNRGLTWLVLLLMVANATSIAMFWLGKPKQQPQQLHAEQLRQPKGKPQDFLVKELNFDAAQQVQLEIFSKEHREAVNSFHEKIMEAKENFFAILKQKNTTDSAKKKATEAISNITQQIDLLTLNHFEKVRALCTTEQQKKFDEIIKQVIGMMSEQRRTAAPAEPLHIGQDGDRPPPPDVNRPPRPDGDRPPPPDDQRGDKPPPPKQ